MSISFTTFTALGTSIATRSGTMRRLEARFFPVEQQGQSYVVVGHVTWFDASASRQPRVEPAPSLASLPGPASLLATLRHLVLATFPDSFKALQCLRNPYWSFVTVDASGACSTDQVGADEARSGYDHGPNGD